SPEEFLDCDEPQEGAGLEQGDPLVGEGERNESERLRKSDAPKSLGRTHPNRLRRLNLALADGLKAGPENLRLVARCVDRKGDDSRPQTDSRNPLERAGHPELAEEELDQGRCPANHFRIAGDYRVEGRSEAPSEPASSDHARSEGPD